MKTSKIEKVLSALKSGERLSAAAMRKRFGVANARATVSSIRSKGFAVYANSRVAGNNVRVTEYRLGSPTKRVVAAGQKAVRTTS